MKMWKKLSAILLVAAMSLTLLTACRGGSAVTPPTNHDKTKEDSVTAWVQEFAKGQGVTLEKDTDVSNAAVAGLDDTVKMLKIQRGVAEGNYQETYKAAATAMGNSLVKQNKIGVPFFMYLDTAYFTKENVQAMMALYWNSIQLQISSVNLTLKTLGVAVTVEDNVVYIAMIFAN